MPEIIRRFAGPLVGFHRPIKRTYYFLEWNQASNKWTRYAGPIEQPLTLHRSTVSRDGTTHINIAIRAPETPKLIRVDAPGFFLKSGTRSIPILNTGDTIVQAFKNYDYPVSDAALTNEDFQLWRNAAHMQEEAANDALQGLMELVDDLPPHLGHIVLPPLGPIGPPLLAAAPLGPGPNAHPLQKVILEKIPQRIAWIIAEAAKEELCPISTNPISPITASVTTCFHVFETEAINEWIARNPVTPCPVCRKVCMATPAYSDSA